MKRSIARTCCCRGQNAAVSMRRPTSNAATIVTIPPSNNPLRNRRRSACAARSERATRTEPSGWEAPWGLVRTNTGCQRLMPPFH